MDPGGTAVAPRGFPLAPVLVAVGVAAAIIVVFGLRSESSQKPAPVTAVLPEPRAAVLVAPTARPSAPSLATAAVATSPGQATPQDPRASAGELEATLRTQRLWGRVEIAAPRVDVRSGSCGDPAMRPAIEGKRAVLRGAGLTRLRCVAQSGAVVFELDL